jgi:hypothetical protein
MERYIDVFGPCHGMNPIWIRLDSTVFVGPMSVFVERLTGLSYMHSHPDYDDHVEFVVYCDDLPHDDVIARFDISQSRFAESAQINDDHVVSLIVRGADALFSTIHSLPTGIDLLVDTTCIGNILETLGVEAARESMLRQFKALATFDNVRHLMLMVDAMTFSGRVIGLLSTGMGRHTKSPFGRAGFERPLPALFHAAACQLPELVDNVTVSIMTGQMPSIGSSAFTSLLYPSLLLEHFDGEEEEVELMEAYPSLPVQEMGTINPVEMTFPMDVLPVFMDQGGSQRCFSPIIRDDDDDSIMYTDDAPARSPSPEYSPSSPPPSSFDVYSPSSPYGTPPFEAYSPSSPYGTPQGSPSMYTLMTHTKYSFNKRLKV